MPGGWRAVVTSLASSPRRVPCPGVRRTGALVAGGGGDGRRAPHHGSPDGRHPRGRCGQERLYSRREHSTTDIILLSCCHALLSCGLMACTRTYSYVLTRVTNSRARVVLHSPSASCHNRWRDCPGRCGCAWRRCADRRTWRRSSRPRSGSAAAARTAPPSL